MGTYCVVMHFLQCSTGIISHGLTATLRGTGNHYYPNCLKRNKRFSQKFSHSKEVEKLGFKSRFLKTNKHPMLFGSLPMLPPCLLWAVELKIVETWSLFPPELKTRKGGKLHWRISQWKQHKSHTPTSWSETRLRYLKYKERSVQKALRGHERDAVLSGGLQGHVEEVTFGLGLH